MDILNLAIALMGGIIGHQITQRWIQRRKYRINRASFKQDMKTLNDVLDRLLSDDFQFHITTPKDQPCTSNDEHGSNWQA